MKNRRGMTRVVIGIIVLITVVILSLGVFLISKNFGGIGSASKDKVVLNFLKQIKSEKYKEAVSKIYLDKTSIINLDDAKKAFSLLNQIEDTKNIEITEKEITDKYYETKEMAEMVVKVKENLEYTFSLIKDNNTWKIYNVDCVGYKNKAIIRNINFSVMKDSKVTFNGKDISNLKEKINSSEYTGSVMSTFQMGEMIENYKIKTDRYFIGAAFNNDIDIQVINGNYILKEKVNYGEYVKDSDELDYKYIQMNIPNPESTEEYKFVDKMFEEIFTSGIAKNDFAKLSIINKFDNDEVLKKAKASYDIFVKNIDTQYTERGGKITVKSAKIDSKSLKSYIPIDSDTYLIQINYSTTRIKDIIYESKENIINESKVYDYDPVFIIKKVGNDYKILSFPKLDHIFSNYEGK